MLSKTLMGLIYMCLTALPAWAQSTLLNASYDPTREFYQDYNEAFQKYWATVSGEAVRINQSHGGSGKQARSVIEGLEADVVTLALAYDIDEISRLSGFIAPDWQQRLPHGSVPYTSTILFLVREGNPKKIKDWDDLTRPGIQVITPNPKTSGGARWNYLAAWGYALRKFNGSNEAAKKFMAAVLRNVPVLDTGARGATMTFVQRGIGDVLVAWENEALLAKERERAANLEIVVPSLSILAEPAVAWVDAVIDKHGTAQVARAYLEYLYSEPGQRLAAKHFYRPRNERIRAEFAARFPAIATFTVAELFGGWGEAQKAHFSEGGIFDQLFEKN